MEIREILPLARRSLFPVPMEKRPRRHNDAIKRRAAELAAHAVTMQCPDAVQDAEGLVEDFMDIDLSGGGYRILRELERSHGWEGDQELCDALNSDWVHEAEREVVAAWVEKWGIVPRLAVGETVTVRHLVYVNGRFYSTSEPFDGVIINIDDKMARYTVQVPSEGHGGRTGYIMPFEDVESQQERCK